MTNPCPPFLQTGALKLNHLLSMRRSRFGIGSFDAEGHHTELLIVYAEVEIGFGSSAMWMVTLHRCRDSMECHQQSALWNCGFLHNVSRRSRG